MDMRNVMISSNVKHYMEAKLNRYNVLWRYKDGLKFRYKDQWIKAEHFDCYFPKVEFRRFPENPNKEYIL